MALGLMLWRAFMFLYYVEGTNRLGGEERGFNIRTEVTVVGQAWAE